MKRLLGCSITIRQVAAVVKKYDKIFIVDAMSSFGGIEMEIADLLIGYFFSVRISAYKVCLELIINLAVYKNIDKEDYKI